MLATGCGRIFILPHMLVGIGLLLAVPVRAAILEWGQPVPAVVDEVHLTRGRKNSETYELRYHYAVDGTRHDDTHELSREESSRWHPGDPVLGQAAVLFGYHICLIDTGSTTSETLWLVGFALLWNGFMSIFIYILWVEPWRTRRLLETGIAVVGEVIGERRYRGKSGPRANVRYRFDTPTGPVEGTVVASGKALQRIDAKLPITVVYDPAKPTRSKVFEYSGYTLRPMVG